MKFGRRGLVGGGLAEVLLWIALWIVFIIAGGIAVYFIVNRAFG